jgi:hypothetical protein
MRWRDWWDRLRGHYPPLPPAEREHDPGDAPVRNHAQWLQLRLDRVRLLTDTEARLERGDHPRE